MTTDKVWWKIMYSTNKDLNILRVFAATEKEAILHLDKNVNYTIKRCDCSYCSGVAR